MIRTLLEQFADLTEPQIHLVYLALVASAAAVVAVATLTLVVRRSHGHLPTRVLASISILLSSGALALAYEGVSVAVPAIASILHAGPLLLALLSIALLITWTAAAPRTGLIVATVHGLVGIGLLVYLVLWRAEPQLESAAWEIRRTLDMTVFMLTGYLLLLTVSFVSSRKQGTITRALYGIVAAGALGTLYGVMQRHPEPGFTTTLVAWSPLAMLAWLASLSPYASRLMPLRHRLQAWLRQPIGMVAVMAVPLLMASLALVVGGGAGDAREASRVGLLGLDLTPGLLVPFAFAGAAGVLAGQERRRLGVGLLLGLTLVTAGLMLLQKEVGNTAVVVMITAIVLLVARGTLLHLVGAGLVGVLGVLVAYRLAPVVEAIPYTFHERIHLWLGGAELMRRGGSIVAANHITYDLGGFWGIGIHRTPGLDLHGQLGALDTDFPMTVVGLYGGHILLTTFVVLFVSLALLGLHTIRCMSFDGDTQRARFQAPLLAALLSVPILSTLLNLAGAITQSSPFTGVPVAFVSYSFTFVLGAFGVVAFVLLVGNRDALRLSIRRGLGEAADAPPESRPERPSVRLRVVAFWRRWTDRHAWRLNLVRLRRSFRLSTLDGGVYLLMLGLAGIGGVLVASLYDRYTDPARYHTHPRVDSTLRMEPRKAPGGPVRWAIVEDEGETLLAEGDRVRLDSLVMRYRRGALEVIGSCFAQETYEKGVRLGFAGMLDAPEMPYGGDVLAGWVDKLAPAAQRNDVVLPFGDIALHHAEVRHTQAGFVVTTLQEEASLQRFSNDGDALSSEAPLELGDGFEIGTQPARRFRLLSDVERPDEICLELTQGETLFSYALASQGPTVLGSRTLLRGRVSGWTVDFEYAERIKAAAEAGILFVEDDRRSLNVIAHDARSRAQWDDETRRLFYGVFRIRDENLEWNRPFYLGGGRRFEPRRELEAFVLDGDRVLGLADSRRFRRPLPRAYDPLDPQRHGLIYDRYGTPVTVLDQKARQIRHDLPGGGALMGYAFESRATRDGLLRVFSPLLKGVEPVPDVDDELTDLLEGRWRGAWGQDVILTLDRELQSSVHEVLRSEVVALERRSPWDYFHSQAVVLGPNNEILAVAQTPDAGPLVRFKEVAALKEEQRERPMQAPAMDAFHRITTMGSAVKVVLTAAALRDPEGRLVQDSRGRWYIDAKGDGRYSAGGRYRDREGVLKSWKGRHIVPLQNYHAKAYGRTISLRKMLVDSVNTAASYLALNLGLDDYLRIWEDMGQLEPVDLLPPELGEQGPFGHLVERYKRDPATLGPAQVAVIPDNERWTLSYTARLALSGTTDMSIMTLAAAVSAVARDGLYYPPRLALGLRDKKSGAVTRFAPAQPTRILGEEEAEVITDYMKDVIHRGTAQSFRRESEPEIWRETGGKTGTGETVVPVDRDARYDRKNKPKTRDNKIFVGIYPASSPNPFVVAVVFEQVSHVDKKVAVRSVRRIIEATHQRYEVDHPGLLESELLIYDLEDLNACPGGCSP